MCDVNLIAGRPKRRRFWGAWISHPSVVLAPADKLGKSRTCREYRGEFVNIKGLLAASNRHCQRSEAIQSHMRGTGLLRRFAPRNDEISDVWRLFGAYAMRSRIVPAKKGGHR
jgi:hypothetical protein